MDDLNNRLRAGILDLRSLAAGLKEEERTTEKDEASRGRVRGRHAA